MAHLSAFSAFNVLYLSELVSLVHNVPVLGFGFDISLKLDLQRIQNSGFNVIYQT